MGSVTKNKLLASRLPEADVEVGDLGTVRVRAMSRTEVLASRSRDDDTPGDLERRMLATAMVNPTLTEDEVSRWQQGSVAGELEPVIEKVSELSGMTGTTAKDAYKEFESDPDSEFRVQAGGDAGHDGGRA